MKLPNVFTSPLAATAGVLAGLGLLAIPLRQLTSAPPMPPVVAPAVATTNLPAWLTLKLLAPAKSVTLQTATGESLWSLAKTPAGDVETRAAIPLDQGGLDLKLTVHFGGDDAAETAVFLTIAPDGLADQTRHAIGRGLIDESLRFSWPAR